MNKQLKQFITQNFGLILLTPILISILWLMGFVLTKMPELVEFYGLLLISSLVLGLFLIVILIRALWLLYKQYKTRSPGTKTTIKISSALTLLLIIPTSIIFYFALSFINHGIDQWFDVPTEKALESANTLVRQQLNQHTLNQLQHFIKLEQENRSSILANPATTLSLMRSQLNAKEIALFSSSRLLLAYSSKLERNDFPEAPNEFLLQHIKPGNTYAAAEHLEKTDTAQIRLIIPIENKLLNSSYYIQAILPIPSALVNHALSIQKSQTEYRKMHHLRAPLKTSITLILSLVFLLTLVISILIIINRTQQLTRPLRLLTRATERVAQGDLVTRVTTDQHDEFSELLKSFNSMIEQFSKANHQAKINHQQTEVERHYLQTVIRNLTNGVITLDINRRLRTVNDRASEILEVKLADYKERLFTQLAKEAKPELAPFINQVQQLFERRRMQPDKPEASIWTEQISLTLNNKHKILLVQGAPLPSLEKNQASGFVIVIDDLTELIQAQRHSAWGDVARRLAHEIRNPLTPIQLSAERMQLKLSNKLDAETSEFVERMTRTIVDQVDTMQELVKAFIEYAHTPELNLRLYNLNQLLSDQTNFYQETQQVQITTQLEEDLPEIFIDVSRLRQVFNNLIKNALEATENHPYPEIKITSQLDKTTNEILIKIKDNGKGISQQAINWIFEPYATDQPKGSGLGLAIVKKIIEEHNGNISVISEPDKGAEFIIKLKKM